MFIGLDLGIYSDFVMKSIVLCVCYSYFVIVWSLDWRGEIEVEIFVWRSLLWVMRKVRRI